MMMFNYMDFYLLLHKKKIRTIFYLQTNLILVSSTHFSIARMNFSLFIFSTKDENLINIYQVIVAFFPREPKIFPPFRTISSDSTLANSFYCYFNKRSPAQTFAFFGCGCRKNFLRFRLSRRWRKFSQKEIEISCFNG